MSENNQPINEATTTKPKKTGLAEAAKRLLEQKKQAQLQGKGQQKHHNSNNQKLKSQLTKKPNNQKKRTGV